MLSRIDWNLSKADPDQEEEKEEEEEEVVKENSCDLVWEGVVPDCSFRKFFVKSFSRESVVREFLEGFNEVVQYWDAAKNYVKGEY